MLPAVTNAGRWLGRRAPEWWLAVCGTVLGGAMLVVTPPFQVPDEPSHFLRAYQVSAGGWVAERLGPKVSGGFVPVSVKEATAIYGELPANPHAKANTAKTLATLQRPLEPTRTMAVSFPNTSLYSPVAYAPQAVAMAVGRAAGVSALGLLYLARLACLAVWLVCVYWAVRLSGFAKWPLAILALSPLSLFINSSASSDVLANAAAFLTIGVVLHLRQFPRVLRGRHVAGLLLLALVLGLVKLPYVGLAALFLAIPRARFSSRLHYMLGVGATVVVALAAAVVWYKLAQPLYVPYRLDTVTNAQAQIHHIASEPLAYAKLVARTYAGSETLALVKGFIGYLGWLEYALPDWLIWAYWALIGLAVYLAGSVHTGVTRRFRLGVAGLCGAFMLTVTTLIYASWSPVAARHIDGLQSRYFIPAVALAVVALAHRPWPWPKRLQAVPTAVWLVPAATALILAALVHIVRRYYVA